MKLIDTHSRTQQARAVLDMWLEAEILDHSETALVCALITILDGVPESIRDYINSLPATGAK